MNSGRLPASTQLKHLKRDIARWTTLGKKGFVSRLRMFVHTPGLWVVCAFRIGRWLALLSARSFLFKPASVIYNYFYFLLGVFVGIDIPVDAELGPGLYIGHYGGIILHPQSVFGENCNLSQGVTIGMGGRAENRGVPRIGNRVYIGPGAKLFGRIEIGNDVAIGANAVVAKSVPDSAVVGGVPAKIINYNGSADFVKF